MKLFGSWLWLVLVVLTISETTGDFKYNVTIFNTPPAAYALLVPDFNLVEWADWEYCPRHEYVKAMTIRFTKKDTKVNAVCLYCAPLGKNIDLHNNSRKICSEIGMYGKYLEKPLECQFLLIGFQAATYPVYSLRKPNYGIVAIKFICSNEEDQEAASDLKSAYGNRVQCLSGQGICGIRTQVDNTQAGLINMELQCCDLPSAGHIDGFCEPKDHWQVVRTCNNLDVTSNPTTCEFQQSIGSTMLDMKTMSKTEQRSHEAMLSTSLGYTAEQQNLYKVDFSHTISATKGSETGYDWTTESSDTFTKMTTTNVKFDVPVGTKVTIFQVVGSCGGYEVRSSMVVRVDTKDPKQVVHPPEVLPSGFFCDSHSKLTSKTVPDPYSGPNSTQTTKPKPRPTSVITNKPGVRPKP